MLANSKVAPETSENHYRFVSLFNLKPLYIERTNENASCGTGQTVAEFLLHRSEMGAEFLPAAPGRWWQNFCGTGQRRLQNLCCTSQRWSQNFCGQHQAEMVAEFLRHWSDMVAEFLRHWSAPVTLQVLWGLCFKSIGQLANNYYTVLHIVTVLYSFSLSWPSVRKNHRISLRL